jgi:hypothetical protein
MMKLLRNIVIVVVMVLTASVGLVGCGAESSPRLACIELMQRVPAYHESFEFWDVNMLREDPDLSDIYQIWYERHLEFEAEHYALESETVDYLGMGEGLDMFMAGYDVAAVREAISLDFYLDASYGEREVWRSEPSHDPQSPTGGWVLDEGVLVRGYNNDGVDEYLSVIYGEVPSMYDQSAADLLERMPVGIMLRIFRYYYPEGLLVAGNSVEKVEGTKLRWAHFYLFESAEAAAAARDSEYFTDIEEEFEEVSASFTGDGGTSPFSDFSMELDGVFVEWSVVMEEEYMIYILFYG